MARWCLLLCLSCFAAGVWAAEIQWRRADSDADRRQLADLAARLTDSLPVRGKMQQQKHMAILTAPLQSAGHFAIAANGDMTWAVETPFAVLYQIREGRIVRVLDGRETEISVSNEPSVYGFFQIVGKLFDLQLEGLETFFTVEVPQTPRAGLWQLRLVPKNRRLAKAIAAIVVTGKEGVLHTVTVQEPNEDYTRIQFSYPALGED